MGLTGRVDNDGAISWALPDGSTMVNEDDLQTVDKLSMVISMAMTS